MMAIMIITLIILVAALIVSGLAISQALSNEKRLKELEEWFEKRRKRL